MLQSWFGIATGNRIVLGKRKHTPPCSSAELVFARKIWGTQKKDFGGRYGCPSFHRAFVSTTGLESFSLRPEKFPKIFSFSGGSVRFFLLCRCSPQIVLGKLILDYSYSWAAPK